MQLPIGTRVLLTQTRVIMHKIVVLDLRHVALIVVANIQKIDLQKPEQAIDLILELEKNKKIIQ
jgi:hypothetical protein